LKKLGEAGMSDNEFLCSLIYHLPGAYDVNRLVHYPGEKDFGGQIGYGMGNGQGGQFVWDDGRMQGSRAAILGNGAFAVENVRSCCENGAHKVFLVTRRMSLACPRVPCWFCHQAPQPTPAWMLLNCFRPMYEEAGMDNPWNYYAVTINTPTNVRIAQSSRFGIGDVTFLCHAWGLLEYKLDTLHHCSFRTLHLTSSEKLVDMHHICKALGLLGDPRVDKLHSMTHRVGQFINGDWRRLISADATGMDATRFTTFSAGPAACNMVKQWYHLHDHPWEMYRAFDQGVMNIMPVHKISNTQPDQAVYMTNIQYEMAAGGVLGSYLPEMGRAVWDEEGYMYCLLHSMHPPGKFLEYCKADWERYKQMFREFNGCEKKADIPYPYTQRMIQRWMDEYNEKVVDWTRIPQGVSWDGPSQEFKDYVIESWKQNFRAMKAEMIPALVVDSKLHSNKQDAIDPYVLARFGPTYSCRQKFMGSKTDSAMDFDEEMYAEWENWRTSDCSYNVLDVNTNTNGIMRSGETWARLIPFWEAKSAHKNLATFQDPGGESDRGATAAA